MTFSIVLKWVAVPIVSFAITYAVLLAVSLLIPFSGYPYEIPVIGAIGAFTWIVMGAFSAPSYNNTTAVFHFIIGVLISWPFLSDLTKPDSVTPIFLPMFFTYISGIIGMITVYFIDKKT